MGKSLSKKKKLKRLYNQAVRMANNPKELVKIEKRIETLEKTEVKRR